MKGKRYTVILQPEQVGYSVSCPAIRGAVSQGDSLDEALANIREAAEGILEMLHEGGKRMPRETPSAVAAEIRTILLERHQDGLPLTIQTQEIEVLTGVPA